MVIATLLIFNVRNIIRIDKEINIYDSESFPFFYVPKIDFVPINLKEDINIYIPISRGCWAIKPPCAAGAYGLNTKKYWDIMSLSIKLNKKNRKLNSDKLFNNPFDVFSSIIFYFFHPFYSYYNLSIPWIIL